ncbi:MAG: hypothetical protein NTV62_02885 [Candidatus Gribaldobacteria bacterium]|nr:hypothetical protein [Candidatus Gribaldobacteria bacterium]
MIKKILVFVILFLIVCPLLGVSAKVCTFEGVNTVGLTWPDNEDCPTNISEVVPCVNEGCYVAANAITIGGGNLSPNPNSAIAQMIARITKYLLYIALVIAPLAVLIGGLMIFFAAGETDKVTLGRNIIIWALVGLAIFLAAKILSNIIITAVTT